MIHVGALKKETKYIGREDKTNFRKTNRPPKEKVYTLPILRV